MVEIVAGGPAPVSRFWMQSRWFAGLLIALLMVCLVIGWFSLSFETVQWATNAGEKAVTALGTLFVIALFVERAQEVYISAWRDLGKARLEAVVQEAKALADNETDPIKKEPLLRRFVRAELELAEYKHDTAKLAFLGGLGLGVLIALAGPRILVDVVVVQGDLVGAQGAIFNGVDILVTGGLIGGGSKGIHKVVMLFLDFVDQTRKRVNTPTGG